jgi:hypothetical protein
LKALVRLGLIRRRFTPLRWLGQRFVLVTLNAGTINHEPKTVRVFDGVSSQAVSGRDPLDISGVPPISVQRAAWGAFNNKRNTVANFNLIVHLDILS